ARIAGDEVLPAVRHAPARRRAFLRGLWPGRRGAPRRHGSAGGARRDAAAAARRAGTYGRAARVARAAAGARRALRVSRRRARALDHDSPARTADLVGADTARTAATSGERRRTNARRSPADDLARRGEE